ncbi:MAG: NAD-dependent epimerase/dehydratase [uncultured bacterium]|nr:MAG: NAD-dependent epimerase/dehydratase [uncultured bacterium]
MKILVTGASGFMGQKLVDELINAGHEIRIFLRHKNKQLTKLSVEVVVGQFNDQICLNKVCQNIDVIYHLAAIRDKWGTPWQEYLEVNVNNTKNLLDAAVKSNVKQFIYISSISVVTPPFDKKYYGQSKKLAEEVVNKFQLSGRINTTIIRPVITYGPNDNGMIYKMILMIKSGKFVIIGNGQNTVHLCYIDDLMQGLLKVLGNSKAYGKTYVLPGPKPIKINDLVLMINRILNKKPNLIHIPLIIAKPIAYVIEKIYRSLNLKNEPIISLNKINTIAVNRSFDYDLTQKELGYEPKFDYQIGLDKTIDSMRKNKLI